MIFVTVGTHEQEFQRLIKKVDNLVGNKIINEDVFIQKGYTKYTPQYCKYKDMIGYDEMEQMVKSSRIIITHGGPGSIIIPWRYNKVPIVVPRNPQYNEHVDEHQILFTKRLEMTKKVIAVYDINDIDNAIMNYNKLSSNCEADFKANTDKFVNSINDISHKLLRNR